MEQFLPMACPALLRIVCFMAVALAAVFTWSAADFRAAGSFQPRAGRALRSARSLTVEAVGVDASRFIMPVTASLECFRRVAVRALAWVAQGRFIPNDRIGPAT